jgi:hypothetical protein
MTAHDDHPLDEETVNEITTNILKYTTHLKICSHTFAEVALRLVASAAIERANGNGPEAAELMMKMVRRQAAILRNPKTQIVLAVDDGERVH